MKETPMSKTVKTSEERVEGKDGLRIFVRSWRPDGKIQDAEVVRGSLPRSAERFDRELVMADIQNWIAAHL